MKALSSRASARYYFLLPSVPDPRLQLVVVESIAISLFSPGLVSSCKGLSMIKMRASWYGLFDARLFYTEFRLPSR